MDFLSLNPIPSGEDSGLVGFSRTQRIVGFVVVSLTGVLFLIIAFSFLPVLALKPQKFVVLYTVGSLFILFSFIFVQGVKPFFTHLFSTQRLPFTVGYFVSICTTIYCSLVIHSYILAILSCIIQMIVISWYYFSYFPYGTQTMKFLCSNVTSFIGRRFGRFFS
jgi:hypothetical protein